VLWPNSEPPTFEQLSFRRGWVGSARFGPDGVTIVYCAAASRITVARTTAFFVTWVLSV
jgi:hypothetical protein